MKHVISWIFHSHLSDIWTNFVLLSVFTLFPLRQLIQSLIQLKLLPFSLSVFRKKNSRYFNHCSDSYIVVCVQKLYNSQAFVTTCGVLVFFLEVIFLHSSHANVTGFCVHAHYKLVSNACLHTEYQNEYEIWKFSSSKIYKCQTFSLYCVYGWFNLVLTC